MSRFSTAYFINSHLTRDDIHHIKDRINRASPPWRSPDATLSDMRARRVANQNEIDMCLNCNYDECINCLEYHNRKRMKSLNAACI